LLQLGVDRTSYLTKKYKPSPAKVITYVKNVEQNYHGLLLTSELSILRSY